MQSHNKIWGLICLLAYLVGGNAHSTQAQDCEFYQSMIQAGDAAFQENNYTQALRKFTSAMIHCPENSNVAYQRMQAVFDRMESLRKRADSVRMIIQEAQARMELAMFDNAVRGQVPDWKGLNNYTYQDPQGLLGQIDSLDLSNNGLLRIPKEVFYCSNLKHLNLIGNPDLNLASLHYFLDSAQVDSSHLQSIYLSLYRLNDVDPAYRPFIRGLELIHPDLEHNWDINQDHRLHKLFDYKNLQYLSVQANGIRNLPEDIGNLSQLSFLDLSQNELMTFPASIGRLSRLARLDISKNKLQGLPGELYQVTRIVELYAHDNTLFEIDQNLSKLKNLEVLDLANNELSALPDMRELSQLKMLNLSGNAFASLDSSLNHSPQLQELFLQNNPDLDADEVRSLEDVLKNTIIYYLRSTLASGSSLQEKDTLYSENGAFYLTVQGDGNVVIYPNPYKPGDAIPWQTNTYNAGTGCIMRLQGGNLAVYDASGRVIWSSRTGPVYNPIFDLEATYPVQMDLENDGTLSLKTSYGDRKVWQSQKGNLYGKGEIFPVQTATLSAGESIENENGFALLLQENGNLQIINRQQEDKVIWESGTSQAGAGCHLDMQADGHLVLYDAQGKVPWKSETHPYHDPRFRHLFTKPVSAQLDEDGVLRLRNAAGFILWESETGSTSGGFKKFPNFGQEWRPGDKHKLNSPDGVHSLTVLNEGIYLHNNADQIDVWSSGTQAQKAVLKFQEDGNLVLYEEGTKDVKPIWASDTHPYFDYRFQSLVNKPLFLGIGNVGDETLSLYSITGKRVWQSEPRNYQGAGVKFPPSTYGLR